MKIALIIVAALALVIGVGMLTHESPADRQARAKTQDEIAGACAMMHSPKSEASQYSYCLGHFGESWEAFQKR